MARKSSIAKSRRVLKTSTSCFKKRESLKSDLIRVYSSDSDPRAKMSDIVKIMTLLDETRSKSFIRNRRRCALTGKPRSVLSRFGMCRNVIRTYSAFGMIVGVKKAS